jgi:hypothetical protein
MTHGSASILAIWPNRRGAGDANVARPEFCAGPRLPLGCQTNSICFTPSYFTLEQYLHAVDLAASCGCEPLFLVADVPFSIGLALRIPKRMSPVRLRVSTSLVPVSFGTFVNEDMSLCEVLAGPLLYWARGLDVHAALLNSSCIAAPAPLHHRRSRAPTPTEHWRRNIVIYGVFLCCFLLCKTG